MSVSLSSNQCLRCNYPCIRICTIQMYYVYKYASSYATVGAYANLHHNRGTYAIKLREHAYKPVLSSSHNISFVKFCCRSCLP